MRIVLLTDWFMEDMGYSDNLLAKALAQEGAEVHLVTSDLRKPPSGFERVKLPGPQGLTTSLNGYTVHRLPHHLHYEGVLIQGLQAKLRALKPEVVQSIKLTTWSTLQAVQAQASLGYAFFLEEHTHWSVFRLHPAWKKWAYSIYYGQIIGPYINRHLNKCYALGPDCKRIAEQYYGLAPDKVLLSSYGVDTDVFHPITTAEEAQGAQQLRQRLGYGPQAIVCIYTGRLTEDKAPHRLAEAVARLRAMGLPYHALFVGGGALVYKQSLLAHAGSQVLAPVAWWQLAPYYQLADVGVWPAQESTSQLDAAACGLPLVLSNRVQLPERTNGNALTYQEPSVDALEAALLSLQDMDLRKKLGSTGAQKMQQQFSWRALASIRLADYAAALEYRLTPSLAS